MNAVPSTLPLSSATNGLPRNAGTLLALLDGISGGTLDLLLPDHSLYSFGHPGGTSALLEVHDWAFFDRVVERGDVGLAESWLDGDWQTPDLAALLTLLAINRDRLARAVYGQWWRLLTARWRHRQNANTRGGSRRNIMAHYDLGNDFYALWLDPTMSYSSALFGSDARCQLADAQVAKYRRVLSRLGARPGERVLEIGCGWGGFAETAAGEAGLEVVGITLSPAQLAYARARLHAAGLDRQVTLALRDYRDLAGERFDHIVSIEMFEAVGERWWGNYFATLQRLLRPDGRAIVQSITIRDDLFRRYRRGTDFIQQHIFPGGMLPSRSAFGRQATRSGLIVSDAFAFGRDYARTVSEWSANFERNWPAIERQGFDERFRRLWRFYLAYCRAGFASGCTDVVQFELAHAR